MVAFLNEKVGHYLTEADEYDTLLDCVADHFGQENPNARWKQPHEWGARPGEGVEELKARVRREQRALLAQRRAAQ
jgi:hypothetical protein